MVVLRRRVWPRGGEGAKRRKKKLPKPPVNSPKPAQERTLETDEVATAEKLQQRPKKKRNRNVLSEEHAHQLRYAPETLKPVSQQKNPQKYVLPAVSAKQKAAAADAGRAAWKEVRKPFVCPHFIGSSSSHIPPSPPFAQHNAAKDWARKHLVINVPGQVHVDVTLLMHHLKRTKGEKLKDGLATARRHAIRYYFDVIFGSPDENAKDEDGDPLWDSVASSIEALLLMPKKSCVIIKKVFADCKKAEAAEQKYDPSAAIKAGRGRTALITDDSDEALLVCNTMRAGLGLTETTVVVNEYRAAHEKERLSYHAVQGFVARSTMLHLHKRAAKKSGKDDKGTPWARSRVVQCKQWLRQLEIGRLVRADLAAMRARDRAGYKWSDKYEFPPIYIEGIAWWDEHHRKIRLGHQSKWEVLLRYDKDGELATEEGGGVLEDEHPTTTTKFPGEARGCFGCCLRPVSSRSASTEGHRMEPFNYTGLQVLGPEKYEEKCDAEMERVKKLETHPWDYMEKYPNEADRKEELRRKMRTSTYGYIDVREIMDHVVEESKAAYEGTGMEDTFMIFHDGLNQWWTPKAQAHMESLGFKDRQLRILGDANNAIVPKHYKWKLVGDSPELCRGLDAHGFADLDRATGLNCALAWALEEGDPMRAEWGLGTPALVWASMAKTWSHSPTDNRVKEDIEHFEAVLKKVVAAEGCVVRDEFLRRGRRARRSDGKGDMKGRLRKRSRKDTIKAIEHHPDLEAAFQGLMNIDDARKKFKKGG